MEFERLRQATKKKKKTHVKYALYSENLQTLATNVKVGGGGDAWSHGGGGGGGGARRGILG